MSKHWRPDDTVVPIAAARARRDWWRASSYPAGGTRRASKWPPGAVAGVVLVAAACAGISVGLYQVAGPRDAFAPDAPIEWDAVQAVPNPVVSAEDRAWARRAAVGEARPSTRSGRAGVVSRALFGLCPSGGGTNCVVDGDTFYLGGDKVRIAGIDAPETHPPHCQYEAQLGEAATEKLRALLNSGAVTMTSIDRDRDVYGRLLRNVAVDGVDVGEAMVGAGVAREYGGGRRSWC